MAQAEASPSTDAMINQFLVTEGGRTFPGLVPQHFGTYRIHAGEGARVSTSGATALLGLAADATTGRPADVDELNRTFARSGTSGVVQWSERLAGRYLILLQDAERLLVLPDAWGSLQAYFVSNENGSFLASSPGLLALLGVTPESPGIGDVSERQQALFRKSEYRSYGDRCPYSGYRRLRANHLLALPGGTFERRSIERRKRSFDHLTSLLANAVAGLAEAHGGPVEVPTTAGVDSRWLALATRTAGVDARLFTFALRGEQPADAIVAQQVAERLSLPHTTIELPTTVSAQTREAVQEMRCHWRDLPKMLEIEYWARRPDRCLVLNGNGGGILRGGFFGQGPMVPGKTALGSLCLGLHATNLDRAAFDTWYSELPESLRSGPPDLRDLFYWEQRMPYWGSDFYAEKSPYVDEVSPYCCVDVLAVAPALGGSGRELPLEQRLAEDGVFAGLPLNAHVKKSLGRFSLAKLARVLVTRRLPSISS